MPKKILVVDDEPNMVDLLALRLKSFHFDVITATDGYQALQKTLEEKPDLILLDVLLPKLTGFDVTKKIRDLGTEISGVPIIILTAKPSMKKFFEDTTIQCFLTKPFETPELMRCIQNALHVEIHEGGYTAEEEAGSDGKKRVVLAGMDEFILKKLSDHLDALGYDVVRALDEGETVKLASKLKPDFVICQFWEEFSKFSVPEIWRQHQADVRAKKVPFLTFCTEAVGFEAMKSVPRKSILTYSESSDLLAKLDAQIKEGIKV